MVGTRKGYLSNSKILQILTNHAKIKADYNHSCFIYDSVTVLLKERFVETIIRIARLSKTRKDNNKLNRQTFKYHKFKQKKKYQEGKFKGQ